MLQLVSAGNNRRQRGKEGELVIEVSVRDKSRRLSSLLARWEEGRKRGRWKQMRAHGEMSRKKGSKGKNLEKQKYRREGVMPPLLYNSSYFDVSSSCFSASSANKWRFL